MGEVKRPERTEIEDGLISESVFSIIGRNQAIDQYDQWLDAVVAEIERDKHKYDEKSPFSGSTGVGLGIAIAIINKAREG